MARNKTLQVVWVGDTAADLPAAGSPGATVPSTEFWAKDGSPGQRLGYNGLGVLVWSPIAGGGGVTVASGGEPIVVAGGPAYTISFGFTGQQNGDLVTRTGGAWARLGAGANGTVLTVVAGEPQWVVPPPMGAVTINTAAPLSGGGVGAVFNLSWGFPGQTKGDLAYFDGTNWVRFPVGTPGQVPTVNLDPVDPQVYWRDFFGDAPANIDLVGGINLTSRFGFPGTQANGDMCFAAGAYPIQWVRLPIGSSGQVLTVSGGAPAWADLTAALPVSWDLYVDPAGNDLNNGLTPATAVATLNRAVELAPIAWTGQGIIHLAAGAYNETAVWKWFLGRGKGSAAKCLTFDAPVVETLPAEASPAGGQGGLSVLGYLDTTSVLVPNTYDGQILEYLTAGGNQGFHRIAYNTAGRIYICGQFPVAPAPGDQFRVVTEGATVTLPAPVGNEIAIIAGDLACCFSGVDLRLNSNVFVAYIALLYNCFSLRDVAGQFILPQLGQLGPATPDLCSTPSIGFAENCGPEITSGCGAVDGGRIAVSKGKLHTPLFFQNNSVGFVNESYGVDTAGVACEQNSTAQVQSCRFENCATPFSGVVTGRNNSTLQVFFTTVDNATTGAFFVENNSYMLGFGLNGTGNGGYGAYARDTSRMEVPDANIGSFVTGTSGDAQVGNNAATSTWAQITTNNPAFCLDTGAPLPTYAAIVLA